MKDGERESPRERLDAILESVVYTQDEAAKYNEPPPDAIVMRAVADDGVFAFHRERLESARPDIEALIRDVVGEHFFKAHSAGCSALLLAIDPNGEPWATTAEALAFAAMAVALKLATYPVPEEQWRVLPLGFPFVSFENLPEAHRRPRKEHPATAGARHA